MSKSTSHSLFCLEGLWLDRVEQTEDIINLHVRKTQKTTNCLACGRRTYRVHKQGRRTIKHMRLNDKLVQLKLKIRSFKCKYCGLIFREPVDGVDRRRTTSIYRRFVVPRIRDRSFRSVAKEYGISQKELVNATYEFQKQTSISWPDKVFALGLDGHSFRGRDMMTTVANITDKKLLTILPNDRKTTLVKFLNSIPDSVKQQINCVCIDLSKQLRAAVEQGLPDRPIVADQFHVVQILVRHLTGLRRLYTTHKKLIPANVLEKNKEDLNELERAHLKWILHDFPAIKDMYRIKEMIRTMYRRKNKRTATNTLDNLIETLKHDHRFRFQELYRTLKRWRDEILNYFTYKATNAFVEGVHTRIKLLKRISYGFRNRQNYIAKMMTAFLPLATIQTLLIHHPV